MSGIAGPGIAAVPFTHSHQLVPGAELNGSSHTYCSNTLKRRLLAILYCQCAVGDWKKLELHATMYNTRGGLSCSRPPLRRFRLPQQDTRVVLFGGVVFKLKYRMRLDTHTYTESVLLARPLLKPNCSALS